MTDVFKNLNETSQEWIEARDRLFAIGAKTGAAATGGSKPITDFLLNLYDKRDFADLDLLRLRMVDRKTQRDVLTVLSGVLVDKEIEFGRAEDFQYLMKRVIESKPKTRRKAG